MNVIDCEPSHDLGRFIHMLTPSRLTRSSKSASKSSLVSHLIRGFLSRAQSGKYLRHHLPVARSRSWKESSIPLITPAHSREPNGFCVSDSKKAYWSFARYKTPCLVCSVLRTRSRINLWILPHLSASVKWLKGVKFYQTASKHFVLLFQFRVYPC